ncbi:MAG: hypothetical protein KGI54_13055 [Pseudomonadota bacterium]|nr:hypothetical protein [Pseudomonadota bacterium]
MISPIFKPWLLINLSVASSMVFLAFVVFSPYYVQTSIEQDALNGEQQAIAPMIDLKATQKYTADWVKNQLQVIANPLSKYWVLGTLFNFSEIIVINKIVQQSITKPLLTATIQDLVHDFNKSSNIPHRVFGINLPMLPDRYLGFSKFEFSSSTSDRATHIILCRNYLVSWKICGVKGENLSNIITNKISSLMQNNANK